MSDAKESLKLIEPGKTYPSTVTIAETIDGKETEVKFILQSYIVGMYCAIYVNSQTVPAQTGDHDNMTLVRGLKSDIAKAIKRGAKVEIGSILEVKA